MPAHLIEDHGYPEVTDEIKARIFGLNAAALYDIDPDAARCEIPGDCLQRAQAIYRSEPSLQQPSLRTYGPKTRREFFDLLRRHRAPV